MKALSLVKFFTLVGFLVMGGQAQAAAAKCDTMPGVNIRTNCETKFKGKDDDIRDCAGVVQCLQEKKEDDDTAKTDKDKADGKCDSLLGKYYEASSKMKEECSRLNVNDAAACRNTANNCKKGLDSFGSGDGESTSMAFVNILGAYGQMEAMKAGGSPGALGGCVIENDDKAATEEERIDDKITRLREEIADLKDKATEADNKFNEKKQDVEKEMLAIEKEADKDKFSRQTKNQEEAGRMQRAIMASEKKRKDNLVRMSDLQVLIADLTFEHQTININLSDKGVTKVCKKKRDDALAAMLAGAVDPKTGKTSKPKFTQKESGQIKKDVKFLETQCLQAAALEKQKLVKTLINKKRKMQSDVENLEVANADETKAIENEIKQMQELKKIGTEEEKKAIEAKLKDLNSLNKTVTDLETITMNKKRTYAEKAKAKEDQINKLILDKQNVKARFAKVSSVAEVGGEAAARYMQECCTNSSKEHSKNHKSCGSMMDSNKDVTPDDANPYKADKPTKAAI